MAKWPMLQEKMTKIRTLINTERPYRPTAKDIFGDLPVLTGGTRTLEVAELSPTELSRIVEFLDYYARKLEKVSPVVAEDFRAQQGFFVDVAAYAKARFDNKPYNEDEVVELPRAGQLGIQALICKDLIYPGEGAATHRTWDLAAVAGVRVYMFGAAAPLWFTTSFYNAVPVVGQRSMIAIMKNGIIECGSTPSVNWIWYTTQGQAYPPFRPDILRDGQVECDKPVYQYHTPGAMVLTPDLGTSLSLQPTRTETISPRLVGLVFAEYTYLAAFQW